MKVIDSRLDGHATYAESLQGTILPDGWIVEQRVQNVELSDGYNSVGYIVRRGEETGFLKAFDYQAVLLQAQAQLGFDPTEELGKLSAAFRFERDLLVECRRLRRVINIIDSNPAYFARSGDTSSFVPYIICELAQSDIRVRIREIDPNEIVWRLQTLHHVATGVRELHGSDITHNDLKTANVLETAEGRKIGDLGSATRRGFSHNDADFHGDKRYAPPEILYGYRSPDWTVHHIPIDLFGIGNIACYLFTQLSLGNLMMQNLSDVHRPSFYGGSWAGTFEEVKPYLTDAFSKSLAEIETRLPPPGGCLDYRPELLTLLASLACPTPEDRGIGLRNGDRTRSLERLVTRLDLMAKRAAIRRT